MFGLDDLPFLFGAATGIVLVMAFLCWYEPRMIFYPHIPTRQLEQTPDKVGLKYESVDLRTTDGVSLHGWFLPCRAESEATGFTLLYFHGNAGNISHGLSKCRTFVELGLDVLAIDYRGYGQSEGRPSEKGTYSDASAAYDYLTQQRHTPSEKIVVYGESLGSGVAVDLAARVPVRAVVLEAPFTSIADVAQRIFWFLPVHPFVRNRYDSIRKISCINAPLLLLHSRNDEFFRIRHSLRLLKAATEPKHLVELRGKHAVAFSESLDICRPALQNFLTQPKAVVR
ncbi:putative protein [Abditibacteriota bacterium]|nr:putative protein [Abditibacteriota bacterium]